MISRRGFVGAVAAMLSAPLSRLRGGLRGKQATIMCPEDFHPGCFYFAVFDKRYPEVAGRGDDEKVVRRTTAEFVDISREELEELGQRIKSRGFVLSRREVVDSDLAKGGRLGYRVNPSLRFDNALQLQIDEVKS